MTEGITNLSSLSLNVNAQFPLVDQAEGTEKAEETTKETTEETKKVKTLFQSCAITIVKEYLSEYTKYLEILNNCFEQTKKPNFLLSAVQAMGAAAVNRVEHQCCIM